ncbi:MAG: arginine--tRNA ligase [Nanoarchaeota archaeon]
MKKKIVALLRKAGLTNKDLDKYIQIPKDPSHGDYSFTTFAIAKEQGLNPAEASYSIVSKIKHEEGFEKIIAVGPYVNFFVDARAIAEEVLKKIEFGKDKYGINKDGNRKKFMIEFSQPNTHKAVHVGHIRGTSLGESIARLHEFCGYRVIRANYSGDTGMHIAKWIWCYTKFHKNEKIKNEESWFAKIYVEAVQKLEGNEKGEAEVLAINRKLDERKDKKLIELWKSSRLKSVAAWKPIYDDLDVKFDKHFFESNVENAGRKIAQELVKKGIARIDDGATIIDLKKEDLGIWVLLRRDGTVLYSAKDLALANEKFSKYKADESLIITSVEQNLHFRQLRKTLELMKFKKWHDYKHLGFESVRLPEGKMSSRTGNNILYADFRNELVDAARLELEKRAQLPEKELRKRALTIAVAAMKYTMLKQDTNKVIIFNKYDAIRFEGDTGPYLLYSYARARSVLRKSKGAGKNKDFAISSKEKVLLNDLARFPEIVANANVNFNASGIAHYAYTLAQTFNEFYHSCQVIGSECEGFRLRLVKAFCQVMQNALHLLGIRALEEM